MKTDKFITFVESLRNNENNEQINAVLEAYDVCMEGWLSDKIVKAGGTLAMIVGMLNSGADAKGIDWDRILPKIEKETIKFTDTHGSNPQITKQLNYIIERAENDIDDPEQEAEVVDKLQEIAMIAAMKETTGNPAKPADLSKYQTKVHELTTK